MGMESFGTPAASEKEQKIKEIDDKIAAKKAEWRRYEEMNYKFRNNFSANAEGKSVDFVELKNEYRNGAGLETEKYKAYKDGERATKSQMDQAQAEIDELERQKTSLH